MTQLANTSGGAITRPQSAPSRLQGEEQEDILLPRIHIFQGLPQEREIYGEADAAGAAWKAGDFINTLTKDRVDSRKFVPVFGYTEYIRFKEPRGSGIEYRTRNKSEVPAGDTDWDRVNARPPKATKFINWIAIFEGDSNPIVLSFKTTCINTGRGINTMEKIRGTKGPGFYEINLRKKQNAKGAWLSPEARPLGDPPEEMKQLAQRLFDGLSGAAVKVDAEGADIDSEFDPDAE